jgi:hypothetical protein
VSLLPSSGVISFARGVPSPDLFPIRELKEASCRAFPKHSATAFSFPGLDDIRTAADRLIAAARRRLSRAGEASCISTG